MLTKRPLWSSAKRGEIMLRFKRWAAAAVSIAALALAPIAPAHAVGPILPWLIARHVVGAVVGLATLPLAVASSAAPDYGGPASGYYPPPNYYAPPPRYYAPPPAYYARGYNGSAVSYARAAPRFYEPPRGYYAPRTRYTGFYGNHEPYQSGRLAYRRR